jgi:cellulose synthase/poly-beta-1,6-N-acetylglucosamine synthase-like glycosyltransferase
MKIESPDKQLAFLQSHQLVKAAAASISLVGHDQIIPVLVSRNAVQKKQFYSRLAEAAGLDYYQDIPRSLNPAGSVIHQIPVTLLQDHIVYPVQKGNTLILITYTPFLSLRVQQRIAQYTSCSTVKLAIAHPALIRDELEYATHTVADIISDHQSIVMNPNEAVLRFEKKKIPSKLTLIPWVAGFGAALWYFPIQVLVFISSSINLLYFLINPFKLFTFLRSFHDTLTIKISPQQVAQIRDEDLPVYTILVPLRGEVAMAPRIVQNVAALDYPKEKLDVKFIVNIDDTETIEAIKKTGVAAAGEDAHDTDFWAHLVEAPASLYTTKPRVCNYALTFARGMLTVIYDAEDRPETRQLKKAYLGFMQSSLDTICLQGKLNFYNQHKNVLTRLFSLEYGFWFEYFLPGLQEIASPIPLGGTSNHFLTDTLKKLGSWDPYNVTEDADLGLRIARHHYKTKVLDSHTLEEANSEFWNWLKQRTRWQKGFLQTFMVHIKHPGLLLKQLGMKGFIFAMITFGANFFLPFVNPFLWIVFGLSLIELFWGIQLLYIPTWIQLISLFNLIFGNLMYLIIHAIAAVRMRRNDLLPFVFLMPVYWMLLSIATHRAFIQYCVNPYVWEKTKHGLK